MNNETWYLKAIVWMSEYTNRIQGLQKCMLECLTYTDNDI